MENEANSGKHAENERDDRPKTIDAGDLFGSATEVHIRHDGQIYRLRITSRNKLILQK